MSARIQIRRDTAAHWTTNNPVLAEGEMGFETDTRKTKVGDGVTAWADLLYATGTSLPDGMIGDQYGGSPEITNPDPTVSSAHYYQVKTNGTTDSIYGRAVIGWHDAVSSGTYNRIVIDNQGTVIKAVDWSNGWGNGSYAYDWYFGTISQDQGGIGLPRNGVITEGTYTLNTVVLNTIDLRPGTYYDNNQFLRIYSTVGGDLGNHIHLTSGDLSVTDIFLGDDNTFVKVNTSTVVIGTAGGQNNTSTGYTLALDSTGMLTYPNGTMVKGSTKRIPGTGNVYASSSGAHLIWTASTSTLVAAKVEVRVQFDYNHRTELFTVQFVKDDTNFNSTVTNYITSDPTYGDPTITPGIDGSGHFTITYTDPHGNGNGFIFDAVEYDTTW